MASITYPNRNGASGVSKDDTTVRPIEFDVHFSKVTAASRDDVVLGTLPKGTLVLAGSAQCVTAGGTAATLTLRFGTTAAAAALTANSAAGTTVANALTGASVVTADVPVNVLVGVAGATGKHRFVLTVVEFVKPFIARVQTRDQVTGTA